jgi:hypothetical protein
MNVSEWAPRYRRFPDDDAFPGPWRNDTAPELVEIMDALAPHDPCEEVSLIKCAQSGGSASAENWIGYISDLRPGPMLFVQATLKAAWDWAAEKFWPMVEATPRLNPDRGRHDQGAWAARRRRVDQAQDQVRQVERLCAAGRRQQRRRPAPAHRALCGRRRPGPMARRPGRPGQPEEMVSQRLKVWRRQGLSKRLKISTPTIKGASKIEAAHNGSDRRRYHLKCPAAAAIGSCPNGRTFAGPTASPKTRTWWRRAAARGSSIGKRAR